MATIADIGTPGQPLNNPPLTQWQAAVRDALTAATTTLVPTTDWVDYGGVFGGMFVTKFGPLVNITAMLKPSAGGSIAANAVTDLATVPAGFRPKAATVGTAQGNIGGPQVVWKAYVTTGGIVQFTSYGALTVTTGQYIGFNFTYPAA